jgi:hypothetical protein
VRCHARGRGILARGRIAADPDDRLLELRQYIDFEVAEVVLRLHEQIAPLEQREHQLADLEEIADVLEQQLPFMNDVRLRIDARFLIEPGVVQLSIEQRALEAFDDLELRIELRLDRETAQQRMTERMNRLRAQRVDAGEVMGDGAPRAIGIGDRDQRSLRANGPRADFRLQFFQRFTNAIRDLSGRFLRERHQHDAFEGQLFALEHQFQHFGHDGGGLAGPCAGLDHEIAACGLRLARRECETLLQRHALWPLPASSVRGSFSCCTA